MGIAKTHLEVIMKKSIAATLFVARRVTTLGGRRLREWEREYFHVGFARAQKVIAKPLD
jgi:hypothetical protein